MQPSQPPAAGQKEQDFLKINTYIKDFLRFNKYQSTLECLEAEEKTKLVTAKGKPINQIPQVSSFSLTIAERKWDGRFSQDLQVFRVRL
jgi:hypothetical protein